MHRLIVTSVRALRALFLGTITLVSGPYGPYIARGKSPRYRGKAPIT